MIQNSLFCDGYIRNLFESIKHEVKEEIENYDANYLLNVSEEDLFQYLFSKYSLDTPHLLENEKYIYNQQEVDIDVRYDPRRIIFDRTKPFYVKGIRITIAIPFKGNKVLFQYQPSRWTSNPPRGTVVRNEIHLIYECVEPNPEEAKRYVEKTINDIKVHLEWIKQDVETFNSELRGYIKQLIASRKDKLLKNMSLIASLNIPIKKKDNLPMTYTVPSIRKKISVERPKVKDAVFHPEPTLSLQDYEEILITLQNMCLIMERSPRTFYKLKEEEIRDHFLMTLNATFEGIATGETFNFQGKTDILIRVENKNIFIAECKFWKGEKGLLQTIDQLLGYTTWRDTKTAILLFNRNKNFSAVLEKIDPVAKSHKNYKREFILTSNKLKNETIFSYVFHHPNDKNREIYLTIMVFDIPNPKIEN